MFAVRLPCRCGVRRGGLPSLSPACPAFSLLSFPHPPNPLPVGKGETKSLFRRGLRPRHPCAEPLAALTEPAVQVLSGGLAPAALAIPAVYVPGGGRRGVVACLPCRCGVRRGGLPPRGTCSSCPGGEDHLKRRSSSPPVPPLLGCRHCPP